MATRKKAASRKPKELKPPKGSYNMQDSTYPGLHSNSLAKKSNGNPYVAQGKAGSLDNVPRKLSWPKGGGVSSSPRPEKTKREKDAYANAGNKDIDRRYMLEPRFGSKKVGDAKDRMTKKKSAPKKKAKRSVR